MDNGGLPDTTLYYERTYDFCFVRLGSLFFDPFGRPRLRVIVATVSTREIS